MQTVTLPVLLLGIVWLTIISLQLKTIRNKMATQADLNAAIAALPQAIETAVETALAPVIAAIESKAGGAIDLQPEIDQLNALGNTVAQKVAADLTPP